MKWEWLYRYEVTPLSVGYRVGVVFIGWCGYIVTHLSVKGTRRVVPRANPLPNLKKGKGSGDRAYNVSFHWNAINGLADSCLLTKKN